MIRLSSKSLSRLEGVHADLAGIVKMAARISDLDFMVLEGLRTKARQAELVKAGASKTMNSRHLTGHAVDLGAMVGGKLRWDWPLYYQLATIVKKAAAIQSVPIEWGGDWKKFKDGPHYQLPLKDYP